MSKTSKPIIFISHVHEDADIAKALSDCISEAFLEAIDVFVSSDGSSIRGGDKWMEKIENNLRESRIVLVIVSRNSVGRKWVYFETGGAFFLGSRVIPLLDGSVSINELGPPLNQLQVCILRDPIHLHHVFNLIAEVANMRTPEIDYSEVAAAILPLPPVEEKRSVVAESDESAPTDSNDGDSQNPERILYDTAVETMSRFFEESVRKMKSSTGKEREQAKLAVDAILDKILNGDPPEYLLSRYKNMCIDQERLLFTEEFIDHSTNLLESPDTPAGEKKNIIEWLGRLLMS